MSAPVAAAATRAPDPAAAAAALREELGECSLVFAFHGAGFPLGALAGALAEAFPGACVLGATAGAVIGPGLSGAGISALGLRRGVRCAARVLDPRHRFDQGAAVLEAMAQELGTTRAALDPSRHLLVLLADGLSRSEERTVASLAHAAPGLRLVGGSALPRPGGAAAEVTLGGRAHPGAHLVALLELELAFEVLHVHHFQPTERRVVVTRADPAQRRVMDLDGWPALRVMAGLYGVEPAALVADPERLTREPTQLAYAVDGSIFVRSVLGVEGTDLLMAGAVDEGAVLRVVRGQGLVERTREGVARALEALPTPASGMLLFNCKGRQLEAEMCGLREALHRAMTQAPAAGFNTLGEQLDGLHVNHTLTGVVFARE